jgi:hypothetical protein
MTQFGPRPALVFDIIMDERKGKPRAHQLRVL